GRTERPPAHEGAPPAFRACVRQAVGFEHGAPPQEDRPRAAGPLLKASRQRCGWVSPECACCFGAPVSGLDLMTRTAIGPGCHPRTRMACAGDVRVREAPLLYFSWRLARGLLGRL